MPLADKFVEKVKIPEKRHDQQLLNDTVLSIKASFRHLEQSCAALNRKVSKSRTRILSQLMHGQPGDQVAKPELPRMPWSEPRVDSRPLARVYAAAAAAAAKAEQLDKETELQSSESESELSGSISRLDLEALANLDLHDAGQSMPSDEASSRDRSSRPGSALSRTSGVRSALRRGAIAATPSTGSRPGTRPNSASIGNPVVETGPLPRVSVEVRQKRPQSHVRLRVQANRPFSAPRMRYERPRDDGPNVPVRKAESRRPSSAVAVGGKIRRADGQRGTEMPPRRPKSAFALRRKERPRPLVPECEPQASRDAILGAFTEARWMMERAPESS